MPGPDIYFLTLHEPYQDPADQQPIDCTIVHAQTLLHPLLPQPGAGRVYRCLVEAPGRSPGCLVPLSTLTFELGGGRLWGKVADWEAVSASVAQLARRRHCDSLRIGLPQVAAVLMGGGPTTRHAIYVTDGTQFTAGGPERQRELDNLAAHVHSFADQQPFWTGDNLVSPPAQPARMPYEPAVPARH